MAASRVCTSCGIRLANYIRYRPRCETISLANSQRRIQHPRAASLVVPSRHAGTSDFMPGFYDNRQKINEKDPRTGVEISTEEWKYVERLIPPLEVPTPPTQSYPTPSGWAPPTGPSSETPYFVRRTKNHQIPVYRDSDFGGSRELTVIGKVDGDIWALAKELKDHIEEIREDINMEVPCQVNEYTRKIWFKGYFDEEVTKYIQDKGF